MTEHQCELCREHHWVEQLRGKYTDLCGKFDKMRNDFNVAIDGTVKAPAFRSAVAGVLTIFLLAIGAVITLHIRFGSFEASLSDRMAVYESNITEKIHDSETLYMSGMNDCRMAQWKTEALLDQVQKRQSGLAENQKILFRDLERRRDYNDETNHHDFNLNNAPK
jgi:hypothetical protein